MMIDAETGNPVTLKAGKYHLRAGFTLQQGRDLHRGPMLVELSEKEANANAHKIEPPKKAAKGA